MKLIHLSQGFSAIVDDADFDWLNQHKWTVQATKHSRTQYAYRNIYGFGKIVRIVMHRAILSPPDDLEVDHIDGNGLNNQRTNLRLCTHAENCRNMRIDRKRKNPQCRFKGVTFYTALSYPCWTAKISTPQGCKNLGYFSTPEEAARAYNEAARKLFGEFARLNPL